jgi:hypothetical protein
MKSIRQTHVEEEKKKRIVRNTHSVGVVAWCGENTDQCHLIVRDEKIVSFQNRESAINHA